MTVPLIEVAWGGHRSITWSQLFPILYPLPPASCVSFCPIVCGRLPEGGTLGEAVEGKSSSMFGGDFPVWLFGVICAPVVNPWPCSVSKLNQLVDSINWTLVGTYFGLLVVLYGRRHWCLTREREAPSISPYQSLLLQSLSTSTYLILPSFFPSFLFLWSFILVFNLNNYIFYLMWYRSLILFSFFVYKIIDLLIAFVIFICILKVLPMVKWDILDW